VAQRPLAPAADFAKAYVLSHDATGNDINGNPKTYISSS
jgi:hypothetical protein